MMTVQRVHTWPSMARQYYFHDSLSAPSNRHGRGFLGVAWVPVLLYDDHLARVNHSINLVHDWHGDAPSVAPEISAMPTTEAWRSSREVYSNQDRSQATMMTVSSQRMGDRPGAIVDHGVSQEAPSGSNDGCLNEIGAGFPRYSITLSGGARSSTTHSSLSLRSLNTYHSRPPTESEGLDASMPIVFPWSRPLRDWNSASMGVFSSRVSTSGRTQPSERPVFHVRSKDVEKTRAEAQLALRAFDDDFPANSAAPSNKRKRGPPPEMDFIAHNPGGKGALCSSCKKLKIGEEQSRRNSVPSAVGEAS